MDATEALDRLRSLQYRLEQLVARDPDQEVTGIAVPVIDAIINSSRTLLAPGDPVGDVVRDIISPEAVAEGVDEPIRAADALIVIDQLMRSIPAPPEPPAPSPGKHYIGNWFDVDF